MSIPSLRQRRLHEISRVVDLLHDLVPKGARILDIGAGVGLQTQVLREVGYEVVPIDMPSSVYVNDRQIDIIDYDGRHIPFDDETFDVVYSSNVLEHVVDEENFQRELHRVLKRDGHAIHVVPSATWRLWTNVGHYLYIPKRALIYAGLLKEASDNVSMENVSNPPAGLTSRRSVASLLRRALLPSRDGEVGNAFTEMWRFSRWRWESFFRQNGWKVEKRLSNGLFYTGYHLLGTKMNTPTRRALSHVLGGSCHIFILSKAR